MTVLNKVSFVVEENQVVALVGPSGGGKSSCIKLLQRLYEPASGQVGAFFVYQTACNSGGVVRVYICL